MTCPKCKKDMCYVCRRPFNQCNYSCPTTNTEVLHDQEVKKAAEEFEKGN